MLDQHGRKHKHRPVQVDMCCFLRAVPDEEQFTQQFLHWADIEETYLAIPDSERPEYIFLCTDNGSGYDPTDEMGQHFAAKFMEKYNIKFLFLLGFAPGQSALNYFCERMWAQFRKTHIGQRFGQAFLREAGPGRRAPTTGERAEFFASCGQEMKDLYEGSIVVSRSADGQTEHRPAVKFVEK